MKICSTIIAAFATSLLALTSANAANEIVLTTHGSSCQATSLGQATNLNASWSSKGISNPNTVASGQSFFVVCPMIYPHIENLTSSSPNAASQHIVLLAYEDLTTQVAQCTFKRYDFKGSLIKSVTGVPASASPSADAGLNFIKATGLINIADQALELGGDIVTVVCALSPQTTIIATTSAGGANPVSP